ncbi:hypothetical protein PV325_013943 [Microctonus aethiopoides]|nr:hypothetical protein PV325_013943 [Microctonus aethiopoides]
MVMIGNFAERKYQLAAQKRSEAAIKFDYYNQAAKYFARECGKAKQFNNWKIDNSKSTHQENIRKAEEFQSRQNRLRELLTSEEEEYKKQFNQLKSTKKSPKEKITLEELRNQLKEKRAEHSLYNPKVNKRIQSYFCYSTPVSRSPLRELNNSRTTKSPKMSLENTNLREESNTDGGFANMAKASNIDYSHVREDFDARALAAKENRFNAQASNFGNDYNPKDINYSSVSSRPLSKTHHSNVTYGKQTVIRDNESFNTSNEKFADEYERETLEKKYNDEFATEDEVDQYANENASTTNRKDKYYDDFQESNDDDEENNLATGLNDIHLRNDKQINTNKDSELKNIEPNCSTSHVRYNDRSRSELIFLYLTHKELKRKIADLELKEQRASLKGRWDDALRLRDMKNRLELIREKELYQRDDLQIDLASRKSVVESIEHRERVLEEREKSCTDSEMYSEDAKLMWNKWVKEDANAFISDAKDQREMLLQQLEEEWRGLAENDKQRLTHTYNNVMTGSSLQKELKLISEKLSG